MKIKKALIYLIKPTLLNGKEWNPFRHSFKTLKHLKSQYKKIEEKEKGLEIEGVSFELLVKKNELTDEMLEEKFYKHISIACFQAAISLLFIVYALMAFFVFDGSADSIFFRGIGVFGSVSLVFIAFCMVALGIKNLHYAKQIKCRKLFPINVFVKNRGNWNPLNASLKKK
jgi:hypothetical protein